MKRILKKLKITKIKEYILCYLFGAYIYGLIEVVVRGHTHWTMALTGGFVMVLIDLVSRCEELNIFVKCLLGCVIMTSFEFGVGMIVNVTLGWNVWNYSEKPFNILGQICPKYIFAWYLLSLPAFGLCTLINRKMQI